MLLSDHQFIEQGELSILVNTQFQAVNAPFIIHDLDVSAEHGIKGAFGDDFDPGDLPTVFKEGAPVSEPVELKSVVGDGGHKTPWVEGPGDLDGV